MKKLFIAVLVFMLLAATAWTADAAKRFGGGQSFGSKPSYSKSYSPSGSASGMNRQSTVPGPMSQGTGQGNLGQKSSPIPQQQPQNRGLFGGMGGLGGMFGGLLVGGLIGSMLFGHGGGMAMGGGIGLLEILLIGALIFIGYRLLTSRRRTQQMSHSRYDNYAAETAGDDSRYQVVNGQNDGYWNNVGGGQAPSGVAAPQADPDALPVEADFLNGAKAAFMRLQMSWDNRDLDDIRQFASPEVMAVISQQAKDDPKPGRTEILRLKADVLDMRRIGQDAVGSVLFEALLREDGETESKTVREVWHFSKPMTNSQMLWKLEGIQQYEG